MHMFFRLGLPILTAALAPSVALAQSPAPSADVSVAAKAFGARARILDASLSPDGKQVALVVPGPGQATVVQVLNLATSSATPVNFANGNPMALTGCGWASNQRLLCTLYGVTDYNYNQYLPYSRLIALDADGKNPKPLGNVERSQAYVSTSDGYVIDWRDGSSESVLLARRYVRGKDSGSSVATSMAQGLGVDLLDTRTAKAQHVESARSDARIYMADGLGNVRILGIDADLRFGEQTKGETTFLYRQQGSVDWKPFSLYNSATETGAYVIGVDGRANVAYTLKKLDGRDALYRVALDGSMKEELAFAHPQVDVGGIIRFGRQGRIVGASYSTDLPEVHYFDQSYAALVAKLSKALPRTPLIRIVDGNADETVFLVHASSDTDPGRYFVYNTIAKTLSPIGQDRPELVGLPVGKVTPVRYPAADGTLIPGYLTLPPGGTGKSLPAIVMPHGGPSARDEWGFDWLAQFFVSRGYAVLQPNYRGSSGYGQGWFNENGFRSWKVALGDVTDAGRWMVKEGIADPAKLAIVGWSYGGYAALQSNVVDPALFKAVIAIAPVTDLGLLRQERRGFTNSDINLEFIGEGQHIEEGSPARHAAAFKAPVLMFHGTKDINVGIEESRAMDRALTKAGKKSELVVYPAIDHQLDDSNVRIDMLNKADAFLSKALGLK